MNPATGRFVTMDTFAGSHRDPYSLHKYLYVRANPINLLDPSGHQYDLKTMTITGGILMGLYAGWASYNLLHDPEERSISGLVTWMLWGGIGGGLVATWAWDIWFLGSGVAEAAAAGEMAGFTATEVGIIREAINILKSAQMETLMNAYKTGTSVTVNIGGRVIQYEPTWTYSSGMAFFEDGSFLLGPQAFSTKAELAKTILHELFRLATTASSGGVSQALATAETQAAYEFAEKAFKVLFP